MTSVISACPTLADFNDCSNNSATLLNSSELIRNFTVQPPREFKDGQKWNGKRASRYGHASIYWDRWPNKNSRFYVPGGNFPFFFWPASFWPDGAAPIIRTTKGIDATGFYYPGRKIPRNSSSSLRLI